MYRLPFELTDSAKLLHFTILGGVRRPPLPPLNDATASNRNRCEMGITDYRRFRYFYSVVSALLISLLILVFYVSSSGFCKQIEVVEKIPFFVD